MSNVTFADQSGGSGATSPWTVTLPATRTAGTLIILTAVGEGCQFNLTSGWTRLVYEEAAPLPTKINDMQVWWRMCDGSEGATISVTGTNPSINNAVFTTFSYKFADPLRPIGRCRGRYMPSLNYGSATAIKQTFPTMKYNKTQDGDARAVAIALGLQAGDTSGAFCATSHGGFPGPWNPRKNQASTNPNRTPGCFLTDRLIPVGGLETPAYTITEGSFGDSDFGNVVFTFSILPIHQQRVTGWRGAARVSSISPTSWGYSGATAWSGTGNIAADDASYATSAVSDAGGVTEWLAASGFDFSADTIPSTAVITGIEFSITRKHERSANAANTKVLERFALVRGNAVTAIAEPPARARPVFRAEVSGKSTLVPDGVTLSLPMSIGASADVMASERWMLQLGQDHLPKGVSGSTSMDLHLGNLVTYLGAYHGNIWDSAYSTAKIVPPQTGTDETHTWSGSFANSQIGGRVVFQDVDFKDSVVTPIDAYETGTATTKTFTNTQVGDLFVVHGMLRTNSGAGVSVAAPATLHQNSVYVAADDGNKQYSVFCASSPTNGLAFTFSGVSPTWIGERYAVVGTYNPAAIESVYPSTSVSTMILGGALSYFTLDDLTLDEINLQQIGLAYLAETLGTYPLSGTSTASVDSIQMRVHYYESKGQPRIEWLAPRPEATRFDGATSMIQYEGTLWLSKQMYSDVSQSYGFMAGIVPRGAGSGNEGMIIQHGNTDGTLSAGLSIEHNGGNPRLRMSGCSTGTARAPYSVTPPGDISYGTYYDVAGFWAPVLLADRPLLWVGANGTPLVLRQYAEFGGAGTTAISRPAATSPLTIGGRGDGTSLAFNGDIYYAVYWGSMAVGNTARAAITERFQRAQSQGPMGVDPYAIRLCWFGGKNLNDQKAQLNVIAKVATQIMTHIPGVRLPPMPGRPKVLSYGIPRTLPPFWWFENDGSS